MYQVYVKLQALLENNMITVPCPVLNGHDLIDFWQHSQQMVFHATKVKQHPYSIGIA
jgi:hypothetical protein